MSERTIDLAYAIDSLRTELSRAVELGENKSLRFDVKEIEMDFTIGVEQSAGDKGGFSFKVLGFGSSYDADDKLTSKHSHTIKLRLTPDSKTGDTKISAGTDKKPDN